jgi:hypothetical protein
MPQLMPLCQSEPCRELIAERGELGLLRLVCDVAMVGEHSTTRSPTARSCWASRRPRPATPSTAQVRSGHSTAHASSRSA